MDRDGQPEEDNKSSDSDDVSLESSNYDDDWCALPKFGSTGLDTIKCSFCEESAVADVVDDAICSMAAAAIPKITISDESGARNDCTSQDCSDEFQGGITCEDDDHIYDVIRDSDVED